MRPFCSINYHPRQLWPLLCGCTLLAMAALPAGACTSILVTRGASADGSVMITYCCDLAGLCALWPSCPPRTTNRAR